MAPRAHCLRTDVDTSVRIHNFSRAAASSTAERRLESQLGLLDPPVLLMRCVVTWDGNSCNSTYPFGEFEPETRCIHCHWRDNRSGVVRTHACSILAFSSPVHGSAYKSGVASIVHHLYCQVHRLIQDPHEPRYPKRDQNCTEAGLDPGSADIGLSSVQCGVYST